LGQSFKRALNVIFGAGVHESLLSRADEVIE
jgi:hypothetical protein